MSEFYNLYADGVIGRRCTTRWEANRVASLRVKRAAIIKVTLKPEQQS